MTLLLELTPGAEAALRARARAKGRPVEEIAGEILIAQLDPAAHLTDATIDPEVVAGIERGQADVKAGRFITLEEYAARHEEARRRHRMLP